jgi:neutral ceramidase
VKRGLSLVLALVLAPACHTYLPGAVKSVPSFDHEARVLRVGVGRADITPPPGVATFGHGPDARVTNGLWTRLYCRAFVFVQPDADAPSDPKSEHAALAIVPCDLPAMSAILQRSVAAEVAARVPIPAPRLMLTATHTHAGPAHFLDGNGYAGLGSTQLPGYDPEMVRFLSSRIADAVEQAYRGAVPAKLRWSDGQVLTLTRNRDIQAFVRNPDPPWAPGCTERSELCAIDPNLSVLEVQAVGPGGAPGCTLGSLTFFAMHPTVLPNTTQLLGADAFGVASRSLELSMREGAAPGCNGDPLAGIVNTNEGDIVPRWVNGSVEEAISTGVTLAKEVKRVLRDSSTKFLPASSVAMRYAEVDMRNNGFRLPQGRHTCKEPDLGVYSSMGATDHRTFLFSALGDEDPRDRARADCQAPKTSFPWYARGESSGPAAFPTVLPFAVTRIDDHAITFVPAELTLAAGHEVDAAVRGALGSTVSTAVVAGLANEYIQYVASRAEYDVQGYEGASTLFGPASAELIAKIASALATRLDRSDEPLPFDVDEAHGHEYFASPVRDRLPRGAGDPSLKELDGERNAIELCAVRESRPPAVCFFWTDGAPGVVPIERPGWISVVRKDGTVVLDDRGVEFLTRIHRPFGDAWLWSTLVRPATLDPERPVDWATLGAGQTLSVRVASPDGTRQIRSAAFTATSLRQLPACSSGKQRLCGL